MRGRLYSHPAYGITIHKTSGREMLAWQTDWTSEFLAAPAVDKYAVKAADGELIALGAYQIRGRSAYVYIIYAESVPPATQRSRPKGAENITGLVNS